MELARRTHAPNLTILLAGCYHNPVLDDLERLPDSEHDALLRDLPCEAQMTNYPGPWVLKRGDGALRLQQRGAGGSRGEYQQRVHRRS
ncbi:hypothetical protein L0Z14_28290 [Burkholderia multivorans]|uniref:hypothetical protein n=1 Tax=Burkholderia multivorans TaxID=87883 RepID=UPI00201A8937|nr:hypothetical protein [Burkholderia multivorans]MCL4664810.1 hypothetical protein [Burkholderia multivorans]